MPRGKQCLPRCRLSLNVAAYKVGFLTRVLQSLNVLILSISNTHSTSKNMVKLAIVINGLEEYNTYK